MEHVTKAARVHEHLLSLWEILRREQEHSLARLIEGALAEIADEDLVLSARVEQAGVVWRSLLRSARGGLADFGIWRDDEEERLRLNGEFQRHIAALESLLN
ncbi:hypothetical protein E2493_09720 [Sphingomonas parva]|uniref:Uncharacterized protein n=1 Tax=Sphingomonas parva TaxID=2555898 RepID=A0A4Y8ZTE7_9SPHN|nr:hypothetical protein [Sphingomonas parva]TFI58405.1 hypothetical protein E2493_09720 [Sphingomonas parva]